MRPVTSRLTRRLSKAIAQSKMNMREIAEQAGVPYGWVRQMKAGGIARPDAKRLAKIAPVLGIDVDELLALTDQLGEADEVRPTNEPGSSVDVAGLVSAMTAALLAQTQALTDLRSDLAGVREDAQKERAAMTKMLAHLADELEALRESVGTTAAAAVPDPAGR